MLFETGTQATAARRAVSMTRNWHAVIGDLPVAFENDIRADFRMQRARHQVALAGDASPVVVNGFRSRGDLPPWSMRSLIRIRSIIDFPFPTDYL